MSTITLGIVVAIILAVVCSGVWIWACKKDRTNATDADRDVNTVVEPAGLGCSIAAGLVFGLMVFGISDLIVEQKGEREVVTSVAIANAQDIPSLVNNKACYYWDDEGTLTSVPVSVNDVVYRDDISDVRLEDCKYRYGILESSILSKVTFPESAKDSVLQAKNTDRK